MDYQAIECIGHFDLAGQSAIVLGVSNTGQQIIFHFAGGFEFVDPAFFYVAMTGCAGTGTATFRNNTINHIVYSTLHHPASGVSLMQGAVDNTINHIVYSTLHQADARCDINFMALAVGLYIGDCGHI